MLDSLAIWADYSMVESPFLHHAGRCGDSKCRSSYDRYVALRQNIRCCESAYRKVVSNRIFPGHGYRLLFASEQSIKPWVAGK